MDSSEIKKMKIPNGESVGTVFFALIQEGDIENYPHKVLRCNGIMCGGTNGEMHPEIKEEVEAGNIKLIETNDILFMYRELRMFVLNLAIEDKDMESYERFMKMLQEEELELGQEAVSKLMKAGMLKMGVDKSVDGAAN